MSSLKSAQCRPLHPKLIDLCISNLADGKSVGQSLRLARQLLESLPEYSAYSNAITDRYGGKGAFQDFPVPLLHFPRCWHCCPC